ncbi:MAG: hypothetical protein AB2A00_19500 [Myxococcota bacterium]
MLALLLSGCPPPSANTDASTNPPVDGSVPIADAGSDGGVTEIPDGSVDGGEPAADAGIDSGTPTSDAGLPVPDAGAQEPTDAGIPDGSADAGADGGSDAGTRAALPPWLTYCDPGLCDAIPPAVLAVCPANDPGCTPQRSTTVLPRVDGHSINAVFFPVFMPEGATLRVVDGNAGILAHLVTAYSPRIEVRSDVEVSLSYYNVQPIWGGTVSLDFVTTSQTSSVVDTVFFRHPGHDTGTAATDFHARAQQAITDERGITGVTSERIRSFVMPTELAGVAGEGNWSYGDGTVTSNYGNPDYIAALGGIMNVAFPRFAHECAHELFNEIAGFFPGNAGCLNEGIADALAYVAGHLPLQDFGPIGVTGVDFANGCASTTEIHDVGNCYFWHVHEAGLLTPPFMNGIFHPQHTFSFDSCAPTAELTGNAILVLFTEAAGGADLVPVLDAMGLVHAGSYDAARAALGF